MATPATASLARCPLNVHDRFMNRIRLDLLEG
jgi:hypothetical protein